MPHRGNIPARKKGEGLAAYLRRVWDETHSIFAVIRVMTFWRSRGETVG